MFKLTLRNLLARKVRLFMSTLAIIIGIGFLAGVLTFSNGLGTTFDGIVEGSTSDGRVRAAGSDSFANTPAANSNVLTPADIEKIAAVPEVAQADGDVEGLGLSVLDTEGDLLGGQGAPTLAFNNTDTPNIAGEQILQLTDGDWPESTEDVLLDAGSAENAGYEVGDTVTLVPPNRVEGEGLTIERTLVGTAEFNGGGTAGATLVIFSTEGAQEIFLEGRNVFTGASLVAADGVSQQEMVDAVSEVLPESYEAVTGDEVIDESQESINQFLDVINIFLIVFAVIAIIVGGFIIANTFTILTAQRIRELALLRALGASRKQLSRSVLLEAVLMSIIGATLGILLGLGLARALAALFRSIGLDINSDSLTLTAGTVVTAYVVGVLVTMASALIPARRAARVAPVAAMQVDLPTTDKSLRRRTLIGSAFLAIGAVLAVAGVIGAPGNDAVYIGVGAVIWIFTAAAISPMLGRPLLLACRGLFGRVFGTTGRLAGENALRNPRRTGATASALMIGLTLVSAVGVLAASLSATIEKVIDEQFNSDIVVSSPTFTGFPTAIGDDMAEVEGVDAITREQWFGALVDGETEFLTGADASFVDVYELTMSEGTATLEGNEIIVGDGYASDHDLDVGSTLEFGFPGGKVVDAEVAGIYEATTVSGGIVTSLDLVEEAGIKRVDFSLSINVADGAELGAVEEDLEEVVRDLKIVTVQDKAEFAETQKAQVNQLLFMIYGLLALAIVIAVVGIINTLGLSVIERTREIGLLRAVGLSRRKLRWMVTLESVTIAVMGAVLGMAIGLVIGIMLRQSLADDLTELGLPIGSLIAFLIVAVLFGVVAAIAPAIRASRMKVLDAIATE